MIFEIYKNSFFSEKLHSEDKKQLKFLPIKILVKFGCEAMRYKKSLTAVNSAPVIRTEGTKQVDRFDRFQTVWNVNGD